MKRPSFQFYPGDWRANAKLRRCTHAERGIWIDLICLLHDSEEYGVLRWPIKDLAVALGCRVADLKALREKQVLKGADTGEHCEALIYTPRHAGKDGTPVTLIEAQAGPIWFSSRMIRDAYLISIRGASTRFGASPEATPTRRHGAGASSSSSSSVTTRSKALSGAAHPDDVDKSDSTAKAKARAAATAAAHEAIDYLNAKAGTKFRHTPANLKFAIDRQLIDKATPADLKAVVDAKIAEASAGKFDRKYLRPETLWNATKFGSYIGQVGASPLSVVKTIHVVLDLRDGTRKSIAEYTWTNADFDAFALVVRTARNHAHYLAMTAPEVGAVIVYVDKEPGLKGCWSPAEVKDAVKKAA